MNHHADQLRFRDWLVKQLTLSRWSAPRGMPIPELCIELGVQESVLLEAIAIREQEIRKRGKAVPSSVRSRRRHVDHDFTIVQVTLPKKANEDWVLLCKALRVQRGTVLRSLLHRFLLDPKRPQVTATAWVYRGEVIHVPRVPQLIARARLTRGAQVALDWHADRWGISPTALTRGILIDFLEGRTARLKIIGFGELWGDPDRYLYPEKFKL